MSNLYGVVETNSEYSNKNKKLMKLSGCTKLFEFRNVAVYSDSENCNCYHGQLDKGRYFAAAGVGLNKNIFTETDWRNLLSGSNNINEFPEGHYVILVITDDCIRFYTDPAGIRDLYILRLDERVCFSTRLDWFSNFRELKINFHEFGTRWLLFNQLSHNAVVHDVERIIAGKSAEINLVTLSLDLDETYKQNWMSCTSYSYDDIYERLKNKVETAYESNDRISLSLSGGMDSRVILSYLLNSYKKEFDAHTFGDGDHPDAVVAQAICKEMGIDHMMYAHHYPSVDNAVKVMRDYTRQTIVNNSASAVIQLLLYDNLAGSNHVIIDGGFGEIWRRDFFNRLLYKGRKGLSEKNPHEIFRHLKILRADIFNDEVKRQMHDGAIEQIKDLFENNPPVEDIGLESWLDLVGIKTRLVNYYGPEQTRLDVNLRSYMPFAQVSLLNILLSIPLNERRNGKLFRKIVHQNVPELKSFPLAKGSFTYPYNMGTLQSRVYSIIRGKLKWKLYFDTMRQNFLDRYAEYIRDSVNSQIVRECELYDYAKVKHIADGYYNGNKNFAHDLDWWLAFDEFRRGFGKDKPGA